MSIRWQVAAQAYTVLHPGTKEPLMTIQFVVDHQQSDISRLRIVPADDSAEAIEIDFATGGYPVGNAVLQPRWLKAFERPDFSGLSEVRPGDVPDDAAAKAEEDARMSDRERAIAAYQERKDRWAKDRDLSADDHHDPYLDAADGAAPDPQVDDEGNVTGEQHPDPYDPDAAKGREAGVENRTPTMEDRKGMVGIDPASGAAVGQPQAGAQAYNPSPGIQPAQTTVDSKGRKAQGTPA